jgi:hypothetical protein
MTDPMHIRPGDTVLIPVTPTMSLQQIHDAKIVLESQLPGVTFQFVGSTMAHALVYRPDPVPGGMRSGGYTHSGHEPHQRCTKDYSRSG